LISEAFNQSTQGVLKAVDPESLTCIVLTEHSLRFVLFKSIKSISRIAEFDTELIHRLSSAFDRTFGADSIADESESVIQGRKERVLQVLKSNRLPFADSSDSIKVLGCLEIQSPYQPENCYSANEIVLSKIRAILSSN
jgi:hypothetical protein